MTRTDRRVAGDVQTWVWTAARQAAESAMARMRQSPREVYIYYTRGVVTSRHADQAPEGYSLLEPTRCPTNLTLPQLTARLVPLLRRVPCLPE